MPKLLKIKEDINGLNRDMELYSKELNKAPGETIQRQTINFLIKTKQEFGRIAPTKENISFEAMRAQRGRSRRRGGKRKRIDPNSAIDLASGKVLGLKIRPAVFAQAKSKFGQASMLGARAKRLKKLNKRGGKARTPTFKGGRKTVIRGGKPLGITAWMISREIAVRRSGIKYLAWGFSNREFMKRKRIPVTKKFNQKDKSRKFIGYVEQLETKTRSSTLTVSDIAGTNKVAAQTGIINRAINRTRLDINKFLLKKAVASKAKAFRSLAGIIR